MTHSILVVDDEADLLNLVGFNLKKAGFSVLTAANGNSALQHVWDSSPDLIILDLMLPDLSGFDICKAIKKKAETRHIPILFLTARSAEMDRIKGFELGAEDYVVKPCWPAHSLPPVGLLPLGALRLPPIPGR
jgi:DNA-binding response OmpR family regulator